MYYYMYCQDFYRATKNLHITNLIFLPSLNINKSFARVKRKNLVNLWLHRFILGGFNENIHIA